MLGVRTFLRRSLVPAVIVCLAFLHPLLVFAQEVAAPPQIFASVGLERTRPSCGFSPLYALKCEIVWRLISFMFP